MIIAAWRTTITSAHEAWSVCVGVAHIHPTNGHIHRMNGIDVTCHYGTMTFTHLEMRTMYGLTITDLSHAMFAARDAAREDRKFYEDTNGFLDDVERSEVMRRAVESEQRARRFQAAMDAMAVATRHERMGTRPMALECFMCQGTGHAMGDETAICPECDGR